MAAWVNKPQVHPRRNQMGKSFQLKPLQYLTWRFVNFFAVTRSSNFQSNCHNRHYFTKIYLQPRTRDRGSISLAVKLIKEVATDKSITALTNGKQWSECHNQRHDCQCLLNGALLWYCHHTLYCYFQRQVTKWDDYRWLSVLRWNHFWHLPLYLQECHQWDGLLKPSETLL